MILATRCENLPTALRRIVAIVVVPTALLGILSVVCWPGWAAWQSQSQWREDSRRILSNARSAGRAQDDLNEQVAAMKASEWWSAFYLDDGSGSGATLLHSDITQLLAEARSGAQSLTPIPISELDHFAKFGMRVAVSLRIDQLRTFLASVANHKRVLKIERLVISAPQTQITTENPTLSINMDIYGFQLPSVSLPSQATTIASARNTASKGAG